MTTINNEMYFATPLSAKDRAIVWDLGWFVPIVPSPPRKRGVYILGNGYTRWISNSWYSDEDIERL